MIAVLMGDENQVRRRGAFEIGRAAVRAGREGGGVGDDALAVPGQNNARVVDRMDDEIAIAGGDLVVLGGLRHGRRRYRHRDRAGGQSQNGHCRRSAKNASGFHESSPNVECKEGLGLMFGDEAGAGRGI